MEVNFKKAKRAIVNEWEREAVSDGEEVSRYIVGQSNIAIEWQCFERNGKFSSRKLSQRYYA